MSISTTATAELTGKQRGRKRYRERLKAGKTFRVYKVELAGLVYIGVTRCPLKGRVHGHVKAARSGQGETRPLYNYLRESRCSPSLLLSCTETILECSIGTTQRQAESIEAMFVRLYKALYGDACCNRVDPETYEVLS